MKRNKRCNFIKTLIFAFLKGESYFWDSVDQNWTALRFKYEIRQKPCTDGEKLKKLTQQE